MVGSLPLLAVLAQRAATVHEVQPASRDVVHSVWVSGPTFTGKLSSSAGSAWPAFEDGIPTRSGARCATRDDTRYTGYSSTGYYCEAASPALDQNAHLLLHSGRLGVVVDAQGLTAPASSRTRNLFPRLGPLTGSTTTAREAYDALHASATNISLDVACEAGSTGHTTSYVLGTKGEDAFVKVGLVRQGHTMTQLTLTGLEFQSVQSNSVYGPCASFVPASQQSGRRLAHETGQGRCASNYAADGGGNHPCLSANYPECQGFVQGSSWGQCWSTCTAGGHPNLWGELSMWGDSIAFELAWDADFDLEAGCSGTISVAMGQHSSTVALPSSGNRRLGASDDGSGGGSVERTGESSPLFGYSMAADSRHFPQPDAAVDDQMSRETASRSMPVGRRRQLSSGGTLSLTLVASDEATAAGEATLAAPQSTSFPTTVSSSAAQVVSRASTLDFFVEVPSSMPRCGYNTACAGVPMSLVGVVATNPHPTAEQTVRLSFSRNFETRRGLSGHAPSAEITGLTTQLWESATLQPSGIPTQLSKNWHTGDTSTYWAGFDGTWWTANSLLRLPANSTVALSLAVSYELYGGIRAWSHAQLSIVGYSDKWLWEQAALGARARAILYNP